MISTTFYGGVESVQGQTGKILVAIWPIWQRFMLSQQAALIFGFHFSIKVGTPVIKPQ